MVAGSLLLSTLVCILLWRLDVGCVCMMFSELLMFGVAFKGRILTSHSISANIGVDLLCVPCCGCHFLTNFKLERCIVS